ncbi:MAG: hypothetical protein QNK19_02435 [Xanthomonadales bacterium]|nr:hypothetical protein [Xanthomonadales bacterium]
MRVFLFLIIALLISPCSSAVEQNNNSQPMESEKQATELAVETLSQKIGAERNDIVLIRLSRFNWPNSALGCPQPGMMYTDAIVPGYLALLKHGEKSYRVHMGNGRGLICELQRMPVDLDAVRLDNLKKMATADLADKLGIEPQEITVVEHQTMIWPDTNFGCSTGSEPAVVKTIRGYGIKLEYRGQTFEYRTSQSKVMPCPPIVTE